jgi:hypothetical protein
LGPGRRGSTTAKASWPRQKIPGTSKRDSRTRQCTSSVFSLVLRTPSPAPARRTPCSSYLHLIAPAAALRLCPDTETATTLHPEVLTTHATPTFCLVLRSTPRRILTLQHVVCNRQPADRALTATACRRLLALRALMLPLRRTPNTPYRSPRCLVASRLSSLRTISPRGAPSPFANSTLLQKS